jgi:hypothetical protein
VPAKHFLKTIRENIDRLNETSPQIPQVVITAFQKRFEPVPPDISIPDICNGLHKVDVHPVNALEEQMQMFRLRGTPATVSTPSTE